jgi:hypothetical protein
MFDINIPEKNTRIMESEYVIPGERIVPPVDTPIGKLGLAIVSFNCGLVCVCVCVSHSIITDPFFVFQVFLMYGIDVSTIELGFTFWLPTLLPVYEFAAEAL